MLPRFHRVTTLYSRVTVSTSTVSSLRQRRVLSGLKVSGVLGCF